MRHLIDFDKRGKGVTKADFNNQKLLKLVETYAYLKT